MLHKYQIQITIRFIAKFLHTRNLSVDVVEDFTKNPAPPTLFPGYLNPSCSSWRSSTCQEMMAHFYTSCTSFGIIRLHIAKILYTSHCELLYIQWSIFSTLLHKTVFCYIYFYNMFSDFIVSFLLTLLDLQYMLTIFLFKFSLTMFIVMHQNNKAGRWVVYS